MSFVASATTHPAHDSSLQTRPRVGFLGAGWIGRHRLEALARLGTAEIAAVADTNREAAHQAAACAPGAEALDSFAELLEFDLDGVVIATPSALHAEQCLAAFERGLAVFCQKPLARDAEEVRGVVARAERENVLLGVDFCYRHTTGMRRIQELIDGDALGALYTARLVFHNAYGPDKAWFYDPRLSGGGCLMDLGSHLLDLALHAFHHAPVLQASGRLFARGRRLARPRGGVEDYAVARLDFASGATAQIECSWNLAVGRDALIEASFYGTDGGAALRNVTGSFYDFEAHQFRGTSRRLLAAPPDDWGGRALIEWAERLAGGQRFDPCAWRLVTLAQVLDSIYGR